MIRRVREWLEAVGGAAPWPSFGASPQAAALIRGVWWLILLLLVTAFAGRATKFIYVDF
jgi:hypothetical protein